MQKAGPELILPPPPPQSGEEGAIRKHEGVYHNVLDHNDIHLSDDKQRLMEKINNDEELRHMRVIEKPVVLTVSSTAANKANQVLEQVDEGIKVQSADEVEPERQGVSPKEVKTPLPVVQGGEDPDPVARQRREKVKEVIQRKFSVC